MIIVSSNLRTLSQAARTKVILCTFFAGKQKDSKMVTVTAPVNSQEAFLILVV
jgi:hypothetical protein